MVPMECRDPKRIKETLIDIKKRVEINPSRPLEEAIQLVIQGLSMKHEATMLYSIVVVHISHFTVRETGFALTSFNDFVIVAEH